MTMLFSFLGIIALNTPPKALSAPYSQSTASIQSRDLSYSTQVTVNLTVAREPRPKAPDDPNVKTPKSKEETTRPAPQAPPAPLISRSFTGRVILRPPGSALITVNDEKRVERQRLIINAQTAVL
ncbi:hypothetical protein [Armatimonas sp.]|uniref:hypothetical protein n=1 Tax=Armatimonas sp. TaxID=1872638 RepID=UPI003752EFAF